MTHRHAHCLLAHPHPRQAVTILGGFACTDWHTCMHPGRITQVITEASLLRRRVALPAAERPVALAVGYIDPLPHEMVRSPRKQVRVVRLLAPGWLHGTVLGRCLAGTARHGVGRHGEGWMDFRVWPQSRRARRGHQLLRACSRSRGMLQRSQPGLQESRRTDHASSGPQLPQPL